MATWSNSSKSSPPTFSNETLHTSTYSNEDKNGEYEFLLQEEDTTSEDMILTEESDQVLLEEIYGDNLQSWTNQLEN